MENTRYGRRREGRWTPIRAKAQDTRANPIELLWTLSLRIMMIMMRSIENVQLTSWIIYADISYAFKVIVGHPPAPGCTRDPLLDHCNRATVFIITSTVDIRCVAFIRKISTTTIFDAA